MKSFNLRIYAKQTHFKRGLTGSAATRVPLAYELHSSPKGAGVSESKKTTPILFLHGFLGSKRENRPVSRYAIPITVLLAFVLTAPFSRKLASELSRDVYTLVLSFIHIKSTSLT